MLEFMKYCLLTSIYTDPKRGLLKRQNSLAKPLLDYERVSGSLTWKHSFINILVDLCCASCTINKLTEISCLEASVQFNMYIFTFPPHDY